MSAPGPPLKVLREVKAMVDSTSPTITAKELNIARSTLTGWLSQLERKENEAVQDSPVGRKYLRLRTGTIIVGSDFHYWPGDPSVMHRAFVWAIKEFDPKIVVLNGDVLDFNSISRHPPIGWEDAPEVQDEIEVAQERLHEIELACKKGTKKLWTLGNHDARFETKLAHIAPQYKNVLGIHLKDHFDRWTNAWSVFVNDDMVIKHRFKGGMHAPQNNTLWSGRTMVTGHLHSAKVQPITDYNGTRYGVDTGCIADTFHPAFQGYTEDNPKNWRGGFGIFTYEDGFLLQPELALSVDHNTFQFRGKLIKV